MIIAICNAHVRWYAVAVSIYCALRWQMYTKTQVFTFHSNVFLILHLFLFFSFMGYTYIIRFFQHPSTKYQFSGENETLNNLECNHNSGLFRCAGGFQCEQWTRIIDSFSFCFAGENAPDSSILNKFVQLYGFYK